PARILLRPMTVVSTGRTPLDLTPLRRSAAVILMAPLLATASPQSPPSPAPPERQVPTFGISTELVYVRFHVEKKGGYLDALKPDQIRVLEDGQPQKIALLETPATRERTVPPEVTLALDVSSSVMDERLLDETLVKDVLLGSLGAQARVGVCAFGGALRCMTPPTREAEAVLDGFQEAIQFGYEQRHKGTRLYASIADLA